MIRSAGDGGEAVLEHLEEEVDVGLHNREALVRLSALPPGSDTARSFNLEYRAADATANPTSSSPR